MTGRHERLRDAFLAAIQTPESEREAFLAGLMDPTLIPEIRELLRHARASSHGATVGLLMARPESEPPTRIGAYRVVGVLGQGGMGIVYEARQETPARSVAIKLLSRGALASVKARSRFELESAALARISHPHIVKVFETGSLHGIPYIVMERIKGEPWHARMGLRVGDRESMQSVLRVALKIARALDQAHGHGLIHRDVKATNVLVDENDEPTLIDFGLARELSSDSVSGEPVGTLGTMAPEQALGRRIDERVDVFGLGATLYQLLTGRAPYEAATVGALVMRFRGAPAAPAFRSNRLVGRELSKVLDRAVALAPEDRYASCALMADDLEAVLENRPIQARPGEGRVRLVRWVARHKVTCATSAIVMLTSAWAASTSWQANARAERERLQHAFQAAEARLVSDPGGSGSYATSLRQQTLAAYRACVDKSPDFGIGWLRIAEVERRLGNEAAAIQALSRAEQAGQGGYCFQLLRKRLLKVEYDEDIRPAFEDPVLRAGWEEVDILAFSEGRLELDDLPGAYEGVRLIQSRGQSALVPEALLGVILHAAAASDGQRVLDSAAAESRAAWQTFDALARRFPCELTALQNVCAAIELALTTPGLDVVESPGTMVELGRTRLRGAKGCKELASGHAVQIAGLRLLRSEFIWYVSHGDVVGRKRVLVEVREQIATVPDAELAQDDDVEKLVELLILTAEYDRALTVIRMRNQTNAQCGPLVDLAQRASEFVKLGTGLDVQGFEEWLERVEGNEEERLAAFDLLIVRSMGD